MAKKGKIFSSGIYGEKASGKWGKLSGAEIAGKMITGEISIKNLHHMTDKQRKSLEDFYKKIASETNEKAMNLHNYLQSTNNFSESFSDLMESGGFISETPPKNLNDMQIELQRARFFNESESSTPEGVENLQAEFEEEYGEEPQPDLNMKWRYYERLKRWNPQMIEDLGGMSETLDKIESHIIAGDIEEWITSIINQYEQANAETIKDYEEKEKTFANSRRKDKKEKSAGV